MAVAGMKRCRTIVADEDESSAETIKAALGQLRCEVRTARATDDILSAVRTDRCGLVVAAMERPGFDAAALCRELSSVLPRPRVILLVDRHDAATLTAALGTGADDVLAKPLIPAEVVARLRNARDMVMLEVFRRSLDGESALFEEITTRSSLHGRRYLQAQLGNELARARRFSHALAMVLVEVGGPSSGERDVRACYHLLADVFRARVDWIARYDERTLALVLPETDLVGALSTAERMRDRLLRTTLNGAIGPRTLPWTIHLGVSAVAAERVGAIKDETSPFLLEASTAYLHEAMQKGPNEIAGGPAPYA